jgi:hypothetical protein
MLIRTMNLISKKQLVLVSSILAIGLTLYLMAVLRSQESGRRPVQQVHQVDSIYSRYGEISRLMQQGAWQEAMDRGLQLKEQLAPDHPLYSLNLTRLGFLAQQLGDVATERTLWQEWLSSPRPEIERLYQQGSVRLADYARGRLAS